jgi:hypothetical protein
MLLFFIEFVSYFVHGDTVFVAYLFNGQVQGIGDLPPGTLQGVPLVDYLVEVVVSYRKGVDTRHKDFHTLPTPPAGKGFMIHFFFKRFILH